MAYLLLYYDKKLREKTRVYLTKYNSIILQSIEALLNKYWIMERLAKLAQTPKVGRIRGREEGKASNELGYYRFNNPVLSSLLFKTGQKKKPKLYFKKYVKEWELS